MKTLYNFIQSDERGPCGLLSVIQADDGGLTFQLQTFRGDPGSCAVPAADVNDFVTAMQGALDTAKTGAAAKLVS